MGVRNLADRRRERRLSVEIAGTLHVENEPALLVFISQISSNGCRFSASGLRLKAGQPVRLDIGQIGPLEAITRWVDDDCAGVELAVALDPAVLAFYGAFNRLAG